MTDDDITRCSELVEHCINNPYFQSLIKSIEDEIKDKCLISLESATEAYYELNALEKIKGKLKTVEFEYEQLIRDEEEE